MQMKLFKIWTDKKSMKIAEEGKEPTKSDRFKYDNVVDQIIGLEEGDLITLTFEKKKEGDYWNKYITSISKGSGASETPVAAASNPNFDVKLSEKQYSIERQKANESACSVVAAMVTAGQLDANMVSGLIESLTELNFNLITKGA